MNKILTYQPKNTFNKRKNKVYDRTQQINKINSQNTMKETIGDIMKQKGISIKG